MPYAWHPVWVWVVSSTRNLPHSRLGAYVLAQLLVLVFLLMTIRFLPDALPAQSLDCSGYVSKKFEKRVDAVIKYIVVAGKKALGDAKLAWDGPEVQVSGEGGVWGRWGGVGCGVGCVKHRDPKVYET